MKKKLIDYVLHLADTAHILSQRNSEWCGHGPILEQDIALTNISLDLLGQARNFYQHAATLMNNGATEDSLAYLRTEREYKNLLLAELPNGHWGQTILRQFFISTYQLYLYQQLQNNPDEQLAAITAKAIKEVQYHVRWSSEWVIRLGDGTAESHQRMLNAIEALQDFIGEMFVPADYEKEMNMDISLIQQQWQEKVTSVFAEATLPSPFGEGLKVRSFIQLGGKTGLHTEHLGFILAEMQHLQRSYPGAQW